MRGSHIGEHRREPVHHSHGVQRQGGSVHGGPLENHGHGFLAGKRNSICRRNERDDCLDVIPPNVEEFSAPL